jgi:diaminohydroxyphosphoribosylaminopyrimidine deaminase/5-amino-6-(5-phosphoribosylamino)uracil reductase
LSLTQFSQDDVTYMHQAIDLARKGIYSTKPNPAVGCVLVKNNQVVGQGWHQKAGQPHAERIALAEAGNNAEGATAYVTLEPCSHFGRTPPCADGLIEAKVAKVVVAMKDPNPLVAGQGIERIRNAGIEVIIGVLEEEAKNINPGFIRKMERQLPFVRLKMASSLDGRTAMENGESHWVTGAESRLEVHKMRARCGALITGIGTVLVDDPSLTVRLSDEQLAELNLTQDNCHPIRVVLDSNLSMPLDAKMLALPGKTILMTSSETVERCSEIVEELHHKGVEIVAVAADEDRLDIESVLRYLASEEQVNDVMVESGAILAGAFIQSGLVNELHCFIAPSLMGHDAKPMFVLPGLDSMDKKLNFTIQSMDRFGDDARLILVPKE